MGEKPAFKDLFSGAAASYSQYRPGYPPEVFAYLASLCPERARAWDCGCGSGQASLGLAEHFAEVAATDPSAKQIAKATPHPKVAYSVGAAEASGLPAGTIDLIAAAQAAHWFAFDAFYAEVRRVAKPGAVIALISYHRMRIGPEIDAVCERFHRQTLAPYWPPERGHVDANYETIPFPFAEIAAPSFALRAIWPLAHVLGYIGTWSAVGLCRQQSGVDPLIALEEELRPLWGDPTAAREITWPINMRVAPVFGATAR
jgi:SAM-dependent methyltransferase